MDPRADYAGREIKLYGQNDPRFDGTTSYRQDYPRHPLEARPHGQGTQWQGNTAKFEGETTYHDYYKGFQLPPREAMAPREYQGNNAPFDGQTTYNANYIPHPLDRPMPIRPGYERQALPFDGSSTYSEYYKRHPMPERVAGHAIPFSPNTAPFDGTTTYNDNYLRHPLEGRPMPQPMAPRQHIPFDANTTYAEFYKPMPMDPRGNPNRYEWQPNSAKFEGMSETMDKYRAYPFDPNNLHGNRQQPPMRPQLPFDGTTTHKEMFQGWQLPPRRPALGVQMVGDVPYILIPANAPLPALGKQCFTTVNDNQTEMCVLVLEGDFKQASQCNVLGNFVLGGLPPGPAGSARVEIVMHIDNNGVLQVTAQDLDSRRHEQWLRHGHMVANLA